MNLLSKSLQVHLFHVGSKHFSTPSKYLDWVVHSIWTLWGPTTLTSMYHGVQIFGPCGTIFWGGVHIFLWQTTLPVNTTRIHYWAEIFWSDGLPTLQYPTVWPLHLMIIKLCKLNTWLNCFVMEVCCKTESHIRLIHFHQLCCGILCCVCEIKPELDILIQGSWICFVLKDTREVLKQSSWKGTSGKRLVLNP